MILLVYAIIESSCMPVHIGRLAIAFVVTVINNKYGQTKTPIDICASMSKELGQHVKFWCLSHSPAAMVQTSDLVLEQDTFILA